MTIHDHPAARHPRRIFDFVPLAAFLALLWIAGGASRADAAGQVFARGAAWLFLIGFIALARPPQWRPIGSIALMLTAAIALAAVHLIPMPPSLWMSLPGRELLTEAAIVTGQEQPWRPLSMSPGATANALFSLIVPSVALLLAASLDHAARWSIAIVLLWLILASCILGLLQFSGSGFDHPMLNDVPGSVSGSFANRNHLALFVGMGCVLAPAWGFRDDARARWRGPVSIALLLFFGLVILATGSRMGMLVGAVATLIGLLNVRGRIVAEFRRQPRRVAVAIMIAALVMIIAAVVLSVALGRAVSLERAFSLDVAEDLRRQALPTVWAMTQYYLPFGTGMGTFDPVYRIHEPDNLLAVRYFNHAHNDPLEWILEGGIPAAMLLLTAVAWWLLKSVPAWRSPGPDKSLARAGSGILLLVLVASVTDYPARTPMIMAVAVIAAVWLNTGDHHARSKSGTARP